MEQSTLQEILGVERDLREQLDIERQHASQWLEATRREIESAHAAEVAAIRRDAVQAEEAARAAAAAATAARLSALERDIERAQGCTDAVLRQRVRACLAALVPEAPHAG